MSLPTDLTELAASLAAHDRVGLISDLDGTLSPIATAPHLAQMAPRARALLAALSEKLTLVALVSGRVAADLHARVGLPGLVYVGNHGLEEWIDGRVDVAPEAAAYRAAVAAAIAELRPHAVPGMLIEAKDVTASFHYRQTADPDSAARTFEPWARAAAERYGLVMTPGHKVFELRPPVEIDKGTTFERLTRHYRLDAAVYLGDDVSDADALRMARHLRATNACYSVGVGVESPSTPELVRDSADRLVTGIAGVEAFLALLLAASSASAT